MPINDWQNLRINAERLSEDIDTLSTIGRDMAGGLYRPAFSSQYEEARRWLKSRLNQAGIENYDDAIGNLIGRIGPRAAPCVMSGSHIDTVADGGSLDGAYGVLAAIEVGRVLIESALPLPLAFECIAFVDEEGHYLDCLGSKATCGALNKDDLSTACNAKGEALTTAMTTAGFNTDLFMQAARDYKAISAYVELHIEQGPVLETLGIPIGNVESIVGTSNLWINFVGEPNHSGTTPMDLRKDAFTGAAEFATTARDYVVRTGTAGRARITYGIVELEPQGHNIIPARVRLFQELREVSDEMKQLLTKETIQLAKSIAKKHRLAVEIEILPDASTALMSDRVRSGIANAATQLGFTVHDMPSGAVHDAQNLARFTDSGMIFVPSKGGRSHRPDEATDWQYLEQGANALLQTVLRLLYNRIKT